MPSTRYSLHQKNAARYLRLHTTDPIAVPSEVMAAKLLRSKSSCSSLEASKDTNYFLMAATCSSSSIELSRRH